MRRGGAVRILIHQQHGHLGRGHDDGVHAGGTTAAVANAIPSTAAVANAIPSSVSSVSNSFGALRNKSRLCSGSRLPNTYSWNFWYWCLCCRPWGKPILYILVQQRLHQRLRCGSLHTKYWIRPRVLLPSLCRSCRWRPYAINTTTILPLRELSGYGRCIVHRILLCRNYRFPDHVCCVL